MYYNDYEEYNFFRPMNNQNNGYAPSYFYDGRTARPANPFDADSRRYQYGNNPQPMYTPQAPGYGYPQPTYQNPNGPVDSRRNDMGGSRLNSDLFRQNQMNYSQPIAQQNPVQQVPQQRPMYMGYQPYNQFDNAYTRPPMPQAPDINWYNVNNRSNYQAEQYPAYQFSGPSYAPTKELDWEAIVKKNFGKV